VSAFLRRWPSAIVHLEGIGLLPLVPALAGHPLLVTTTDAWSLRQRRLSERAGSLPLRLGLRAYAALSSWVERRYLPQAGAVQVVSAVDADYLRRQVPGARVVAVPIALPEHTSPRAAEGPSAVNHAPTVLFWGDIGVPHIAAGLEWLLREVRARVGPVAQWVVLGRREPGPLLAAIGADVRFLTWVDDVDAMLRAADVVVLPDASGTGLKNRAIHAMACGVPVVGTPHAFEGFDVTDESNAMVKASPEAFADAISRLLSSSTAAKCMAAAGRKFALAGYSADSVSRQWQALYLSLAPRLKAST
jgi:glycosyltransferase involved in cell wall biosynthesis